MYNGVNGNLDANNLATGAVTTAKIADSNVTTAKIADSAVDYTKLASGVAVQQVSTPVTASTTGTTILPGDDTIPQNTEGDQYMTQAITPKSATNVLVIKVYAQVSVSTPRYLTAALFQDSTANALSATAAYGVLAGSPTPMTIMYSMVAGTTSATTFKVRIGPDAAGTVTFNGSLGTRLYGAISKSYIEITEYKA